MTKNPWNAQAEGSFFFETQGFWLVVREVGGSMRFQVFRRVADPKAIELVGSGTERNKISALTSAMKMAENYKF